MEMKDGTKGAEATEEKSEVLQQKTEDSMLIHAAAENAKLPAV